jgi:hypothetical protein
MKMQLTSAIKKLNKSGFEVLNNGNRYKAKKVGLKYVVEFISQETSVLCIRVLQENDYDNSQSDYSAGTWCDNLTQAILLAH